MAEKVAESSESSNKDDKIISKRQDTDSIETLVEKESREKIELDFHTASKAWRKQINHLQGLLVHNSEITSLQNESRILEENMYNFTRANEALEVIMESSVEKIALYGRFEEISRENSDVLKQVHQTIRELRMDYGDKHSAITKRTSRNSPSHKSGRSATSRYSKGSTSSSTRLRRQDLEEEAAILKAKIRLAQEKEELNRGNRLALEEIEEKMRDIRREEMRVKEQIEVSNEKFKMREELAEAEARIEVCSRYEYDNASLRIIDEISSVGAEEHMQKFLESQPEAATTTRPNHEDANVFQSPESKSVLTEGMENKGSPPSKLDPHAPNYVPIRVSESVAAEFNPNESFAKVARANEGHGNPTTTTPTAENANIFQTQLFTLTKLLEAQNQSRLPLPDPGIFNGDPLKFPIWLKAFETLIESRSVNPDERLHFLGRYVAGEAKEVIQGFMLMDGEDAYQRAKEMLSKRYGDSFAVASAFRKKLDAWPQIAPYDSLGLRKYADFLVQCEKAMEKVESLKVLNDDQENQKMASKLPKWALTRWGRLVYKSKHEKKKFPPFSDFVSYIVTEADIACDPINNRQRKSDDDFKGPKARRDFNGFKFSSRGRAGADTGRALATQSEFKDPGGSKPEAKACVLCSGNHELESCNKYKEMDVKTRKEFAKTKGLCFGCLGRGHLSRECKKNG